MCQDLAHNPRRLGIYQNHPRSLVGPLVKVEGEDLIILFRLPLQPLYCGYEFRSITYLHALVATHVTKRGIVLDRWSKGLSVMLEKIFGCSLITILRSILLMEADFNATNKVIDGDRMLHNMRMYRLIPEEVYSKRNCLADDGTLSMVLFYNIVQQLQHPAALVSVDADNCYNCIAHPMASVVF